MGHCKSKRKIVQGGNISKQKKKAKKNVQELTPLFQSTKILKSGQQYSVETTQRHHRPAALLFSYINGSNIKHCSSLLEHEELTLATHYES